MDNGFDHETGEVLGAPASVQAIRAQNEGWRQKRHDERGVGFASLYKALERAYKEIAPVIINDAASGQRYRYATLKQLIEKVRAPLLNHGVIIRQGTENAYRMDEGGGHKTLMVPVYTDLIFADTGEVVRTKIDIPIVKADPQSVGSAVTYGKRYSLLAALGLATDDDDDAASAQGNQLDLKNVAGELKSSLKKVKDMDGLRKWRNDNDRSIKTLSEKDFEALKADIINHRDKLLQDEGE